MSLINQDIKNFVQGISQQPSTLRDPEQLEEQINGFSSEASGLQKRPPTLFISKLHKYTKGNKPLVHFIDRDAYEKYTIIFDGDTISVYDLAGKPYTVNFEGNSKAYITLKEPRSYIKCVTIADYTFVLNTTKVVKMTSAVTPNVWASQGALVNIKSGQYGRTYKIVVNGSTIASHATPDGSDKSHTAQIATDYIAEKLAAQARNNGYSVTTGSSWLYIYGKTISKLEVYDGYNNLAAFGVLKSTQKFSNLPNSAPDGFIVKVAGEKGSNTDDYYVKYVAADEVWKECARPNISCSFDTSVMPHVLIREADGTFTFCEADWSDRDVGDDDSNPAPSFVGQNINDMFYFRNRLGFLSGENVILTRSADFFNFWMASAMEVQDTDPIDLAVSDNKIATLYHAVPFDAELILFSKDAQFALRSDSVLSPKDAILTPPVTHFGCSLKATPVNAGRNIYFLAERSEFSTVREFFTAADNTDSKDAQDITSHVPSFVPNGVYKIVPSSVENILLFLTEGEEDSMYVYKYLFIDSIRQQASWSKWTFNGTIYGASFVEGFLYVIVERNDYLCLERMSFTFNTEDLSNEPYRVLLDSKLEYLVPASCYDDIQGETTINLQSIYGDIYDPSLPYGIVTYDGLFKTANSDGSVVLQGDYSNKHIICGLIYLFRITLSTLYVKREADKGVQSLLEGRLQLRQLWLNYANSGCFVVKVNISDKDSYEYVNTERILGTSSSVFGSMVFPTGKFTVPIQSVNTNCSISVESDNPTPLSLIGAGWIGNYVRRTRLY